MNKLIGAMLLFWVLIAATAMAQGTAPVAMDGGGLLPLLKSWPGVAKILGAMLALQVLLRGVAEALIKLSDVLSPDVTIDNKIAAWCSEAAWVLGVVLSKVGYGTPDDVVVEKAKDLQGK